MTFYKLNKHKLIRKLKIPFLIFSIIFIIACISSYAYYLSIYKEYLANKEDLIQTLNYYNYIINKKAYPKIYEYTPVNYNSYDLKEASIYTPTIIYDINGKQIGKFSKEDRNIIGLNNVSPHFINALITTEDRKFYSHKGLDYKAMVAALLQNIMAGRIVRGGSTITQQLAKVLFTTGERTIKRKVYEIIIAREIIEENYDKNDILEMYVNYIYFGHNINGIGEAARLYFNKEAKDLKLTEASLLAGIIANPSIYSPFVDINSAKKRHLKVLRGLVTKGLIDKQEYKKIHKDFWEKHNFEKMFNQRKYKEALNKSPYVIEEVKRQIVNILLEKEIFKDPNRAYNFLYTNGLKITTYIDISLQRKAQEIVKSKLKDLRKLIKKDLRLSKYNPQKIQAALIAIEPSSGGIVAFVGGDEFSEDNQYNRAFQARRQPGSVFKPIFYAGALDDKYITPYSLVLDKYEPIALEHNKVWKVKNYGAKYANKPITTTEALKVSSNQVAARLVFDIGVSKVRNIIQETLNISKEESLNLYKEQEYSIVLGSIAITPLDIAKLYTMIANKGARVETKLIKNIQDLTGKNIIFDNKTNENRQIISKEAAYQITEMMRQVLSPGGTGYSAKIKNNIQFDIAGKTGTSQNSRDLWFAGFTPELSTVVWIGHDDNKPLIGGGGTIAGPIFAQFMKYASKVIPFSRFEIDMDYNFKTIEVCRESGQIAVENKCTNIDYSAQFITGTEPSEYCTMEHKDQKNPFNQLLGIPISVEEKKENNLKENTNTLQKQEKLTKLDYQENLELNTEDQ